MTQPAKSRVTRTPWITLSIPRSTWKKWAKKGATPPPLPLPGAPLWDKEALEVWYSDLAKQGGVSK